MSTPFKPLTKEAAAKILSVSKRTVENWIADGTMLAPTAIGRRVYWHPDAFYSWMEQRFSSQPRHTALAAFNESKPTQGRPRAIFQKKEGQAFPKMLTTAAG